MSIIAILIGAFVCWAIAHSSSQENIKNYRAEREKLPPENRSTHGMTDSGPDLGAIIVVVLIALGVGCLLMIS